MTDIPSSTIDQIDRVFADMDVPQHPGGALLIAENGAVLYKRGYGLADIEADQPITPDTSFYLASVSKQFTTMAMMILAEWGVLRYEDALLTFFPDFPQWGAGITVRHLMNHTSGLPDYFNLLLPEPTDGDMAAFTRAISGKTSEDALRIAMSAPGLLFPVGAEYRYSNSGYVAQALIVQAVSGQSLGAFLEANVFDPLGMKHTLVYDASHPALHKLAHGYFEVEGQFQRWDYPLLTAGDGGMFSTVEDLFLWDQALYTEKLVSKATLDAAFTSGITNDGKPTGYGFGWGIGDFEGARRVAHAGGLGAYSTYIIRFPDNGRAVILLTNYPGKPTPPERAQEVAKILFGYKPENA